MNTGLSDDSGSHRSTIGVVDNLQDTNLNRGRRRWWCSGCGRGGRDTRGGDGGNHDWLACGLGHGRLNQTSSQSRDRIRRIKKTEAAAGVARVCPLANLRRSSEDRVTGRVHHGRDSSGISRLGTVGAQIRKSKLTSRRAAIVNGGDIVQVKREDPVGSGRSWSAHGIVVGDSGGGGDVHIHRWVGEGVVQGLVHIG